MFKNLTLRFLKTFLVGVLIVLCPVIAEAALSSIAVTPASSTVAIGTTNQFTATGTFRDGSTQILGAGAIATSIATGLEHTCALLSDGTIKCWGGNNYGQLGNGTTIGSHTPVSVNGISNATAVVAGQLNTCALLSGGTVKCWGYNNHGQLGDGTTASSPAPVTVSGIFNAIVIASADFSTCAILADNTIKCWGYNELGQLGDGSAVDSSIPVTVNGISTATAIAMGIGGTCSLLSDRTVKCWGWNTFGQVGNGTTNYIQLTPVAVSGIFDAIAIVSAGSLNNCVLLSNGTVKCWGDNYFGQLGNGSRISSIIPVTVNSIDTAVAISGGHYHSCALLSDNTMKCWGYNYFGQLGNGQGYDYYRQPDANIHSSIPVAVSGIFTATAIATKFFHTCSVLFDGTVKCWGYNNAGQLGDNNGSTGPSFFPLAVLGLNSSLGWSSSNTAVATINNDGIVIGMSSGTTTITATFDGMKGSTFLTIWNPSSFWSQLQNSPQDWFNLRKTYGIQNKSADDIIKTAPNDWVVKVATTTDSTGNPIEFDGYRWYGVIDPTDNAVGWMVAKNVISGIEYLSYDANAQTLLETKATTMSTRGARIPVILQAVDNYYIAAITSNSLYGGGGGYDGLNNFQTFIQGSAFPKELIMAIIAEESGNDEFNNEICAGILDGGVGIMQITSTDAKGLGSSLFNKLKLGDCNKKTTGWVGMLSQFYSNASQGIYANIKDGFRVLQDKFAQAVRIMQNPKIISPCPIIIENTEITCTDLKQILTVWGYNGFGKDKYGDYSNYLGRVAQKLKGLNTYFVGAIDSNNQIALYTVSDKLTLANDNKQLIKLNSPGELQVIDPENNITGVVDGVTKEDIPLSVYRVESKGVAVFFPGDIRRYKVVGTSDGEYGLDIDYTKNGVLRIFRAVNIPTTPGEIHEYLIDWDALDRGERGVTVRIDTNGDGIIDRVVQSDGTLTEIEPPTVTVVFPAGEYLFNATTTVQFTTTDASGVATTRATLNGVSVTNGQMVTFTKPGTNIIEISAMDNEGNSATETSTFRVTYATGGFLPPIKSDGTGVYNQGRTFPVRFSLFDANNNPVSQVIAHIYVVKISNDIVGNDEIPLSTSAANIGNQFRYDSSGKLHIFNLSTGTMSPGVWQIKAVLDSGQVIMTVVSIK